MKTLIRSDSSTAIGLGHIMRDLVLATQLEGEILFACQPLEGNMIEQIPYDVHVLQTNEPNELLRLIKTLDIDVLVIDHYGIDASFERYIKDATGVKILSFDDTYKPHYCDIVLNHNLYANAACYTTLVPSFCEIRAGSAYTLIREEFKQEKNHRRQKIYDIFIAMGGSDPYNMTMRLLTLLPDHYRICIVTTHANPHIEELQNTIAMNKMIDLHINSHEIAKLLHQSHIAIVTPSVIVHEVLYMHIPFIAIKVASNQDDMYQYLKEHNYCVLDHEQEISRETLLNLISHLITEPSYATCQ